MKEILPLDPTTYQRHKIHGENRAWAETNCYCDVLIELLHAWKHEPIAGLAFTLAADFEGDQWTFFKYPHADLLELYGMELQELNPWRSLVHHIEEQVHLGRPVMVELDSFFLPDTQGTAYKIAHVKSTIAVNKIDIAAKKLGYFHNQSYHSLEGQDFIDIFQTEGLVHQRMMPPFIEFVKFLPLSLTPKELLERSLEQLKRHLRRTPQQNPFLVFKEKFEQDIKWLLTEDIAVFHSYSFATLRQYGACFELAETYLKWLQENGQQGLEEAIRAFYQISQTAKTLQFQLARSLARRKPLELTALDSTAQDWAAGMEILKRLYL